MPPAGDENPVDSPNPTVITEATDTSSEADSDNQHSLTDCGFDSHSSLTLQQVRERTRGAIRYCIQNSADGVINAPPSAGKSHGAVKVIADVGVKACYFTARRDLYEQIEEWCEAEGLRVKILPSMPEDCRNYERGSVAYNFYNRGMRPSRIHNETGACSVDCLYMQQLPTLTEAELAKHVPLDQYDVLIGHPNHAFVEPYTRNRTVFFDDISKMAFIEEFGVSKALLNGLLADDEFSISSVAEIYAAQDNDIRCFVAVAELESLDFNPWQDRQRTTHADALKIVHTLLQAEQLGNGYARYHCKRTSHEGGSEYIGVTDGNQSVYLLKRPPLAGSADSVITLNAYPILHQGEPTWLNWRLGVDARLVSPLTGAERTDYISEVLNISVVQTSEFIKPYSSGKYVSADKDAKLIRYISNKHDTDLPVITANKAIGQFDSRNLPVDEFLNFASVESSNVFGDRRVGLVLGSPEWQLHHNVKLIAAFMDNRVEWNGERGVDKSFGEVGDPIMRAFREYMVGQAILRFGRKSQGATVYVHTSAIPDDIPVKERLDKELGESYASLGYQILQFLEESEANELTTAEIREHVEGNGKAITRKLSELDSVEQVKTSQGPKPAKWTLVYE